MAQFVCINNTLFAKVQTSWYHHVLYLVYTILAIVYLIVLFIIVRHWSVWFALPYFLAEVYTVLFMVVSLICAKVMLQPVWKKPQYYATVDIFIPTLNEPEEIVRLCALEATKVRGVNNVFILDDGNRPEIRQLAGELGVDYLARTSNEHAKAGNMNYGIQHSTAEFMIFVDVDHVPQPKFIERTLGYFDDEKLAFVQTPQVFYNTGSIQHRSTKKYALWNEQTMFYESIQPSKNTFNAAFFCGSGAILRRSAIDSIGGFATGTATEDIHTSIRLHAKGWRSLFLNEKLAYGLAPLDLKEYHRQRVRWGAGSLGLLFRTKDSPLFIRGLTIMQRICYLNSTLAYAQGLFKLFYYSLPVYILFMPILGVKNPLVIAYAINIPFLLFSFWVTRIYSRGTYHLLYTEQYNIANIISNIMSLKGIIKVQKKFGVSVKMKKRNENSFVRNIIICLALMLLAAELFGIMQLLQAKTLSLAILWNFIYSGLFWNTINLLFVISLSLYLFHYNKRVAAWFGNSKSFSTEYYEFIQSLSYTQQYTFARKRQSPKIEIIKLADLSQMNTDSAVEPSRFSFFLRKSFMFLLSII